jgi:hypothetical protein
MLRSEVMLVHGARIEKPATPGTDSDWLISVLNQLSALLEVTVRSGHVPQMELTGIGVGVGVGAGVGVGVDLGLDVGVGPADGDPPLTLLTVWGSCDAVASALAPALPDDDGSEAGWPEVAAPPGPAVPVADGEPP